MAGELDTSIQISAAGMKAQTKRLRAISENLANADSRPTRKGENPFRRKIVTFKTVMDKEVGDRVIVADKILRDKGEFGKEFDPTHPAADENGYVLTPNVNPMIEMIDMRQAQRSYEANLNAIDVTRSMLTRTMDLISNN